MSTAVALFEITRLDGRSNAQVVIDLVGDVPPGTIFTYDEIINALQEGATNTVYTIETARGAVLSAHDRLLKEKQRLLYNIRGVGYRVAHAREHNRLVLVRKRKASVQMRKGMLALKQVRWDELDPEARKAHEATLMVVSALYTQQESFDQRLRRVEEVIARRETQDNDAAT